MTKRDRFAAWYAKNRERNCANGRLRCAERTAFISWVKIGVGCYDCGYNEHPAALDFDHVRGGKTAGLGQMQTYSLVAIQAEMMKCEVVCANCHRVRTATRKKKAK